MTLKTSRWSNVAILAVAAAFSLIPFATAHDAGETDEHGVITVTSQSDVCTVHVRVEHAFGGPIIFQLQRLDGESFVMVAEENLTGTPETAEGEKTGLFTFDFDMDVAAEDSEHLARLVLSFEDASSEMHSAIEPVEGFVCVESPSAPPVCEATLVASAESDGVHLEWEAASEEHNQVAFYRVLRDGLELAQTQDTSFVDTTAAAGQTYVYEVQAHGEAAAGGTVFTSCGTVEVTAVPFWGAPILGAIALVGTIGAYATLRRR